MISIQLERRIDRRGGDRGDGERKEGMRRGIGMMGGGWGMRGDTKKGDSGWNEEF